MTKKLLDIEAAKKLGYSDAEIKSFMAQNNIYPKPNLPAQGKRAVQGVGRFAGNILSAPKNIYQLGKGLVGGDITPGDIGQGLVKTYKDRYGGWDELARTAYFDPIDMASDISLASGIAAKGLNLAGASGLGKKAEIISQASNPMTVGIEGAKALGKPAMNLFSKGKVPDFFDDASSALAKKSLRPSPSQQENFLDATGMDIGDYARDMGVQGGGSQALKKIEPIVSSIQKKYNALARSGKPIDPTDFIDEMRATAREIVAKDFSTEAQAVAKNMMQRADLMETQAIKYMMENNTRTIPIDILTSTKSSAFGKVPKGTMADPTKMHGGKLAGGIGVGELERLAPGTQKLGKAQQAAMAFQDIAKKQSGIGKGTQLFNLMKPSGTGAILGGVLGGAVGAGLGGAATMAANNPTVLAGASKALHSGANLMRGASLPAGLGKAASQVSSVAKYSQPLSAIQKSTTEKLRGGLQQPRGIPMERSGVRGLESPKLQPYKQFNTQEERKKKNNYPSYY